MLNIWQRGIDPNEKLCCNCAYYEQHYTRYGGETCYGHCTYPRIKERGPLAKGCKHYLDGVRPDTDSCAAFRKEYETFKR